MSTDDESRGVVVEVPTALTFPPPVASSNPPRESFATRSARRFRENREAVKAAKKATGSNQASNAPSESVAVDAVGSKYVLEKKKCRAIATHFLKDPEAPSSHFFIPYK